MDQRISFLTLAVSDLATSRQFYLTGLGWRPELEVPGEVIMIRVGAQVMLSLWDRAAFEAEVGEPAQRGPGVVPITVAHNVASPEQVDAVLALAKAAGAPVVHAGRNRAWGGYTGYFADPDGFRWEIAYNPSPIGESLLP